MTDMLHFQTKTHPESSEIEGDVHFAKLPLNPFGTECAIFSMFSVNMILIAPLNDNENNMHRS